MQLAKRTMVLASGLLLPVCLSACASSKPQVLVMAPPANRLTCMPEPSVPAEITDSSTAEYIVALASSGQTCRSAVRWLRDWARGRSKSGHE